MFRYEIPLYSSYIMVRLHLLRIFMMQHGVMICNFIQRIHEVFETFQSLKKKVDFFLNEIEENKIMII